MANTNYIIKQVNMVVDKYKTNNPYQIAEQEKLYVKIFDYYENVVGFHAKKEGVFIIGLNSNIDEELRRVFLAHELGHLFLHDVWVPFENYFIEYCHRPMYLKEDKEADKFASWLLIDSDDLYDYIFGYQYSISMTAKMLGIPEKYVKIKLEMMMEIGYKAPKHYDDENFE